MPLTVGGGIASIDDVRDLLMAGADKVAVNTAAVDDDRSSSSDSADRFGSQCVVVSIDARRTATGRHEPYTHAGSRADGSRRRSTSARAGRSGGAGEILLTSIDRDGTMDGYDLELTRSGVPTRSRSR